MLPNESNLSIVLLMLKTTYVSSSQNYISSSIVSVMMCWNNFNYRFVFVYREKEVRILIHLTDSWWVAVDHLGLLSSIRLAGVWLSSESSPRRHTSVAAILQNFPVCRIFTRIPPEVCRSLSLCAANLQTAFILQILGWFCRLQW